MHCSRRLIVQTILAPPGVSARDPSIERRNYLGEKWPMNFAENARLPDFHVTFRDLLHVVNLRHGTNGFTSLPKEGVLRIFSPWRIRRLGPGLNPRTWVPEVSTLPLDHRSWNSWDYLRWLWRIKMFGPCLHNVLRSYYDKLAARTWLCVQQRTEICSQIVTQLFDMKRFWILINLNNPLCFFFKKVFFVSFF